ncbi:MAG: hypothetical protein H6Q89_1920 [Myxococcaceae bacterium]|nr:hypothetical protein [Myxococcaceae bacterium]
MGAIILWTLLAQPLALEKLSGPQATAWFSKSHLEASPARDQILVVNEPVTILLAEGSGSDDAVVKGLRRVLEPGTPRPASKGWEALLWNYVHAGPTGDPKVTPRAISLDGRSVSGAEFTVASQGRVLYAGLLLTQLLPGARVRVVLGIREGDAKGWLAEVGAPAAFVLTEGAAWFSPAPVLLGKTLKIPTGCAVEPAAGASKRVTISCESSATLTWAPLAKEPDLAQYRRSLEEGARGSPCEFTFTQPPCTVAGLAAQCILAECKAQAQASSLAGKLKFEDRHYLVVCSNAPRGAIDEPVCNGLFKLGK